MGTMHIFLFNLQCRLELPLVSTVDLCYAAAILSLDCLASLAERTRLAEHKQLSFLNLLRQNGRRVTKVYCM